MSDKYHYQTIAWGLAERFHSGQRYGERPYLHHLSEVCEGTRRAATDLGYDAEGIDKICAVAILHDVLEDSDCDLTDLSMAGIPKDMQLAIINLTKVGGESYEDYLKGVRSTQMSLIVKREDTMANLTQSQKEGDVRRIIKYVKQLSRLYL